VAEKFLHRADVGAVFQQVVRRMAEGVTGGALGDALTAYRSFTRAAARIRAGGAPRGDRGVQVAHRLEVLGQVASGRAGSIVTRSLAPCRAHRDLVALEVTSFTGAAPLQQSEARAVER